MTLPDSPRLERLGERSRNPHRLGRHIQHDPQSLAYAAPALPKTAIRSVTWTRRVPVFDQAATSSCTGNAAAGWLATDDATRPGVTHVAGRPVDEAYARDVLYHLATTLDEFPGQFPPEDGGSSGLGAAKALKSLGLAKSYTHAFTMRALQSALQHGPVLAGLPWYQSMFDVDNEGCVIVDPASGLAGGHELCLDELDVEQQRVGFPNSWGPGWGRNGRAAFRVPDLRTLLADSGDVTVPAAPAVTSVPPVEAAGCLGQVRRIITRSVRQEHR